MQISQCPACGASVPPSTARCPFCGQYFVSAGAPTIPGAPSSVGAPNAGARHPHAPGAAPSGIVFRRQSEPSEGAFSLAVPVGWQIEGGLWRADLTRQVIDAQSIQPKLDFSVKRDDTGTVLIRWGPETRYCDLRMTPAGMMGAFPPGSLYQGMPVSPVMSAVDFLVHVALPWAHPAAVSEVRIVDQRPEPLLVEGYRQRTAALGQHLPFQYDGGTVTLTYVEGGVRLKERAHTVIENMGPMAAGMWSNKDTFFIRAPENEFERWTPVLYYIRESVQIDPRWLAQEIVNQEFLNRSFLNAQQASMARDRRMLEIQQQIQQVDRQITEHRARTNAEIHNDAYLTMMELEEYVNPYTNEPETGSNQWQHRWVTEDGAEFYTDAEEDDPNVASLLNRTDWKRTAVRRRFPH